MAEPVLSAARILVVEDDPGDFGLIRVNVRLAKLELRGSEKSVAWAQTLAEGIAVSRRDKPDIVLLDLSLPDSSGLATVQALRAAIPATPIVVLTGQDDNTLAVAALEAGAQDYLVKGKFDHDALGRAVRNALVRGGLEQRIAEREQELRTIIESEPECVKQLAVDGTLLNMNRAGLNMIEADSLEQVVGQKVQQLVLPAYRDAFMALTQSVFAGESGNLAFEIEGLKGGHRWLETYAVPLRNAHATHMKFQRSEEHTSELQSQR